MMWRTQKWKGLTTLQRRAVNSPHNISLGDLQRGGGGDEESRESSKIQNTVKGIYVTVQHSAHKRQSAEAPTAAWAQLEDQSRGGLQAGCWFPWTVDE